MTIKIPFIPVTPAALARLTGEEQIAFGVAADYIGADQKPPMDVIVTLLLAVQRLITEPADPRSATTRGPELTSSTALKDGDSCEMVTIQHTARAASRLVLAVSAALAKWHLLREVSPSRRGSRIVAVPDCARRLTALPPHALRRVLWTHLSYRAVPGAPPGPERRGFHRR